MWDGNLPSRRAVFTMYSMVSLGGTEVNRETKSKATKTSVGFSFKEAISCYESKRVTNHEVVGC